MFVKHVVLPIEVRQKIFAKFSKLDFTKSLSVTEILKVKSVKDN